MRPHKLWAMELRIDFLKQVCRADPGDYMAQFELEELSLNFDRLLHRRFEVIQGGQIPNPCTLKAPRDGVKSSIDLA